MSFVKILNIRKSFQEAKFAAIEIDFHPQPFSFCLLNPLSNHPKMRSHLREFSPHSVEPRIVSFDDARGKKVSFCWCSLWINNIVVLCIYKAFNFSIYSWDIIYCSFDVENCYSRNELKQIKKSHFSFSTIHHRSWP